MAVLARLPQMYDEPFADPSQIPTHLVSALARREVTVALSGDGGDELFGGYDHYARALRLRNATRWMPASLRRAAAGALTKPSRAQWERVRRGAADRAFKLAGLLSAGSQELAYRRLWSRWMQAEEVVVGGTEPLDVASPEADAPFRDALEQMMYLDLVRYLPDDILVKVDRASMAVSLEVREPLLDHHLIRFAFSLPSRMRTRGGERKWILRRLLDRYVPERLMSARKSGFSVPMAAWLRGPLRPWAEELLDARQIESDGMVVATTVRRWWQEHLSGRADLTAQLWSVLMFQAWLRATPLRQCTRVLTAE
jgi:asparagine synthase (glutamine-hydrolysing)